MDTIGGERVWYITVATKPNDNLELLKKLCRMHDADIIILGMGDKDLVQWGKGFGVKIRHLKRFLSRRDVRDDDIILFTDAYDVLLCDTIENITQKYLSFDTDIVFSCEKFCHPDESKKKEYRRFWQNRNQDIRSEMFLNSGTFIGRAGSLRQCLDRYIYKTSTDDQRYWTTIYLDQDMDTPMIDLDFDSKIFMCVAGAEDDMYMTKQGRWRNRLTGTNPSIIHLNGFIKERYDRYYECYLNKGITDPTRKEPKRMNIRYKQLIALVIIAILFVLVFVWFTKRYQEQSRRPKQIQSTESSKK